MRTVLALLCVTVVAGGCEVIGDDDDGTTEPDYTPIAEQTCYANFLDDSPSEQAQAYPRQRVFLYSVGNKFTEHQAGVIRNIMDAAEKITPLRFVRSDDGNDTAKIHWRVVELDRFSGFATFESVIKLDPAFFADAVSAPPTFLLSTGKHELGHILGLSHPGKDQDGAARPNDWNVNGSRDGANAVSDDSVMRPDGKSPLDSRDTIMSYQRSHHEFKWMDVMTLRQIYDPVRAPNVQHFDGSGGTC